DPGSTAVTFQRNSFVWPALRGPSAHVLVAAESPPFGPSSTTHTGRSGSESRGSLLRWPNGDVPWPGVPGAVSTVTATFGAALRSALRTRIDIVALWAIDCDAGNFASATSSR